MENKHLNEALNEAGKLIKSKLRVAASDDGFKASGRLDKSFDYSVVANELQVKAEKYAGALSEGISTNGSGDKADFERMQLNIIKWAKTKGIRPQVRDKKGRFQKVTDRTWKSLGYVLSRSIRRKGISKRFGYKGSGFITQVKSSMEKKLTSMILEGYKKDLIEQINKK
jgi:folate-dependent tRNA-U54 methylase TrmFO/GidA